MSVSQSATRVIKFPAQGDAVTGNYIVYGMRVTGTSTAAGDIFNVQDTAGNEVFKGFATGANFTDSIEFQSLPMAGIKLASNTANHFALYVYIR